jgi:glutathione S-transferase
MTQTTPTLVLHDFPNSTGHAGWASFSPFVLEVDRALKLAKLPFEKKAVNIMKLKQLNPLGQLPVLTIDTENVPDSTRILHRIEQLAPGSMNGGLDARGTAEAWLWEEFSDTALYPYVVAGRWADDRAWPTTKQSIFAMLPPVVRGVVGSYARRDTMKRLVARDFTRAGLDACFQRMNLVLDQLDARAPEEGFWMGPRPSVADVGLFAQLHSLRIPHFPWLAEDVARRQRLSRWLDRFDAATGG